MITFEWSAELECFDTDQLVNVIQRLHWRCVAKLDGRDSAASGLIILDSPNPKDFVPAPEGITSDIIRSWVVEADEIEKILSAQLQPTNGLEVKIYNVPILE